MKPFLVKQESYLPTRKVMAFTLATFLVTGFIGVLESFFPGVETVLPEQEWINLVAGLVAAWFVKDRYVAPV